MFGKTKGSQGLFASWLCASVLACAVDDPQPSNGYQPGAGPGPGLQADGGTVLVGDAGIAPGPGATPGGGVDPGPVQPTGPVDLGMDSAGDTFFRADTLVLMKPTLVHGIWPLKVPVTGDAQKIVNDTLTMDGDVDGYVDASLLVRFLKSLDPSLANSEVTIGGGRCPFPVAPDRPCGAEPLFPFQSPGIAYTNGQSCALVDTTEIAANTCFATSITSIVMNVPLLGAVPLQDGQVIGSWQDGGITNGRVRGFLPKTVAANTKLPAGLDPELVFLGIVPGMPLSDFLPDNEVSQSSRGEEGWWFLLSFTAKPVRFDPAVPTP